MGIAVAGLFYGYGHMLDISTHYMAGKILWLIVAGMSSYVLISLMCLYYYFAYTPSGL